MLERGISGLFVVDASGTLAGIVTEGDLLRRDELGTAAAAIVVAAADRLAGPAGRGLHPHARPQASPT